MCIIICFLSPWDLSYLALCVLKYNYLLNFNQYIDDRSFVAKRMQKMKTKCATQLSHWFLMKSWVSTYRRTIQFPFQVSLQLLLSPKTLYDSQEIKYSAAVPSEILVHEFI